MRGLSLQQENDSLRLALKVIVQEKDECDSHPQKTDDHWSLVENSHTVNRMKIKCNQHTIPNDNCNRFEPLRNGVQARFVNVSLTPNNEANKDRRNRVPNTRHSQTSTLLTRLCREISIRNSSPLSGTQGKCMAAWALKIIHCWFSKCLSRKGCVVAEELFSINMNIVIVMFPFRSADLLFTCGQRIRT